MIPDNENDVDYDNERESYNSSEELMPSALPLFSPDEFEEGDEISIQASKYLQKGIIYNYFKKKKIILVREEAKNIVFKTNTNKKLRIPNSRSNFPKDYLIADEINLFDEIEHYDQEWKFNTIKNFEILYKVNKNFRFNFLNKRNWFN